MVSLAAVLVTTGALAQSTEPAGRVWSEAEVIARAEARSPEVQSARASLDASRAWSVYGSVPLLGNPVVGIRAMVGVPDREAATYAVAVGVPIDVSGRQGLWRREARWAVREAEARLEVALNDARAHAREAYVDVALADALFRINTERLEAARELLERVRSRAISGVATALDVALSERELAEAEADLSAARRTRFEAAARLREALDLAPDLPVYVLPLPEPTLPAGLTREAAVARAIERRREHIAIGAEVHRYRISADRLRAEAIAPLLVAGEYEMQGYVQGSVGASAQWALPLIQTAQGERAVALGQASARDTDRALRARRSAREAGAAWDRLSTALAELRALRERALPALERALALSEQLLGAGAVDYFRVLYARRELAQARARAIEVAREAWHARVALDHAIGGAS